MIDSNLSSSTTFLDLLGRNDPAAWERFCARYRPALLAFARRAGLPDADAEELAQETLIVFVSRFRNGDFDPARGRLRAWLQGIALNKLRELRRARVRHAQAPADQTSGTPWEQRLPDDEATLTTLFEAEWRRELLARALATVRGQVDAKTFEAFRLFALEGQPAAEVAAHLGLASETIYVHKARVLTHLRDILARWVEEA